MNKRGNRGMNQEPKLSFGSAVKRNLKHSVEKPSKRKKGLSGKEPELKKQQMSFEEEPSKSPEHVKVSRTKKNNTNINSNANGKEEQFTLPQHIENGVPSQQEVTREIPSGTITTIPTSINTYKNKDDANENGNVITLQTSDGGKGMKPFRPTGLLNKSQLKLASYIKQNKDVKLSGTKRFADKSGEYYLKNVQMQNSKKGPGVDRRLSLNNPTNLENCLKSNVNNLKHRASKIITMLPENSLTPIPTKLEKTSQGVAGNYRKKELKDAERTAVFIRRMEYATSMKKSMTKDKGVKDQMKKIQMIQEWWKTMFKIIKLQKNIRGFLFRKKLMDNLEHQEKLLQFITEFENIHNYHLYKEFFDNLKKKAEYNHAKQMEKCEDFAEKLDNLERLRDLKNFKDCFEKWRGLAKEQKKQAEDNLANKLADILDKKIKDIKKDAFDKIKDKTEENEKALDDKIKDFQKKKAAKNFMDKLLKPHRLNKILNDVKNKIDDKLKKEVLDKLKNMPEKCDDEAVERLGDLLGDIQNKKDDDRKREFFDKLKDIQNKSKMKDALDKWKKYVKDKKDLNKLLNKLIRHKKNELKKKNQFEVESGINGFELLGEKKPEPEKPKKAPVFVTTVNDINILAPEKFNPGANPSKKEPKIQKTTLPDQLNKVDEVIREKARFKISPDESIKLPEIPITKPPETDYLRDDEGDEQDENKNEKDNLKGKDKGKEKGKNKDKRKDTGKDKDNDNDKNKEKDKDKDKDKGKKRGKKKPKKKFIDNPDESPNEQKDIPGQLKDVDDAIREKEKFHLFPELSDKMPEIEEIKPPEIDVENKNNPHKKFRIGTEESERDPSNKKTIPKQLKDVNDAIREKEKFKLIPQLSDKLPEITEIKPPEPNGEGSPDESDRGENIQKQLKEVDEAIRPKQNFNIDQEPSEKMPEFTDLKEFPLNNVDDAINSKNKNRLGPEESERDPSNRKRIPSKASKTSKTGPEENERGPNKSGRANDKGNLKDKLKSPRENEKDTTRPGVYEKRRPKDKPKKGLEENEKDPSKRKYTPLKQKNVELKGKPKDKSKSGPEENEKDLSKKKKKPSNKGDIDEGDERDKEGKPKDELKTKPKKNEKSLSKKKNNPEDPDKENVGDEEEKSKDKSKAGPKEDKRDPSKNKNIPSKQKDIDLKGKPKNKYNRGQEDKDKDKDKKKDKNKDNDKDKKKDKNKDNDKDKQKDKNKDKDKYKDKDKNKDKRKYPGNGIEDSNEEDQEVEPRNKSKLKKNPNKKKNKNEDESPKNDEGNEKNKPREKYQVGPEEEEREPEIKKNIPKQLKDVDEALREKGQFKIDNEPSEKMSEPDKNSIPPQLDDLDSENKNKLLKDAFDKWKDTVDDDIFKDKFKDYINSKKKQNSDDIDEAADALDNILKNKMKKDGFDAIKDNTSKEEEKPDDSHRRISHRRRPKKPLKNKGKNNQKKNDKKLLDNAFQQWRDNTSFEPTRNILDEIKKNKSNNELMDKLKKQTARFLLNIRRKQDNLNLKKYFEKWRKKALNNGGKNQPIPRNIYRPIAYENRRKKYGPFLRSLRQFGSPDPYSTSTSQYIFAARYRRKETEKNLSDTTSANESEASEITLVEKVKIVKKPRDYAAQSFFIDKKLEDPVPNEYKYSGKKIPMKLKGDFASLIEKNPNILHEKNPRIQLLNSTCGLAQIIDDEDDELGPEEIDKEINKLSRSNNNPDPTNNKILNRVVQNCDNDVYPKKDYEPEDKWYSTSIPLNAKNNRFKLSHDIKPERDKDNIKNKFELIQKEPILEEDTPARNYGNAEKSTQPVSNSYRNAPYKLQEMNNTSQFYRSPLKSPTSNNDNHSRNIRPIYTGKRTNDYSSRNTKGPKNLNSFYSNNPNDTSRNGLPSDIRNRSIDDDNGIGNRNNGQIDTNDYDDYEYNKKKLFL